MVRFLHTSDWQLGMKLRFVPGDRGAQARSARFETVRRIAEVAKAREVDAVVVAGDVFDDNAVGPDTLQRARDALATFAPIPVLLLPGNHDSGQAGGALERLEPKEHGLDHVDLLLDREPRHFGQFSFFPCPLERRHTFEDPTADLPSRGDGEGIRVAIAHGGIVEFSETTEAPNRIDAEAVLAKDFDYLALGDWHGIFQRGPRIWYPGTPEPTRFKEKEPGHVLVVEIGAPGEEPRVERVPVAWARWLREERTLDGAPDLEALESWFQALPEKSRTLVELRLQGALSLAERGRLEEFLEQVEGRLLYSRISQDALTLQPQDDELRQLELEGFVGRAVEELEAERTPAAQGALLLLYRFLQGETP